MPAVGYDYSMNVLVLNRESGFLYILAVGYDDWMNVLVC